VPHRLDLDDCPVGVDERASSTRTAQRSVERDLALDCAITVRRQKRSDGRYLGALGRRTQVDERHAPELALDMPKNSRKRPFRRNVMVAVGPVAAHELGLVVDDRA